MSGSARRRALATSLACFLAGIGIGWWIGAERGEREAERLRREAEKMRDSNAAMEAENDRRQAELDARMERLGLR